MMLREGAKGDLMQRYVVGFLFSTDLRQVALITKNRPQWQAGLLNGIGGKIEAGESAPDAMRREFLEEAGVDMGEWAHFASMTDQHHFSIDVFAATGAVDQLVAMTDEAISVYDVKQLHEQAMVENAHYLILMAADVLRDGRPGFVRIEYPV